MPNRRVLKKEIKRICGDLAKACLTAELQFPETDEEKWKNIVMEIAMLQDNALKRANVDYDRSKLTFDSGREYRNARGAFYKKAFAEIQKEFDEHVAQILKQMNAMLPQAAKEAAKKD